MIKKYLTKIQENKLLLPNRLPENAYHGKFFVSFQGVFIDNQKLNLTTTVFVCKRTPDSIPLDYPGKYADKKSKRKEYSLIL